MELTVFDLGTIYVGYEWSRVLQFTEDPIEIQSTTSASPIVLTTKGTNLFANSDKVQVFNHKLNLAANGNSWPVANRTYNTIELTGSTGSGIAGGATGMVAKCIDGTNYDTPTCKVRPFSSASGDPLLDLTLDWVTRNIFRYSINLTDTQTLELAAYHDQKLALSIKTKLGSADMPIFLGEVKVKKLA